MTDRPPYRISPSRVGRHFFLQCDRHLRFTSAATPAQRQADGVPTDLPPTTPLTAAIFQSGFDWEVEAVARLGDAVHVPPGEGPVTQRTFRVSKTLALLRSAPPGTFIYQATLRPPPLFSERHGIPSALVQVSSARPDLIEVLPDGSGGRLLRVIDMKRGQAVRVSHRVQILFYALLLDALLTADEGTRVDLETGGVWLGGTGAPTPCDLSGIRPHLEQLLREDLRRIFTLPPHEVDWHVRPRCEWCPYFEHCRGEMRRADDLSRVPRLSAAARRTLREQGISTVAALGALLAGPPEAADAVLAHSASLAGQRPHLTARVRALLDAQPQLHGRASLALPREEPHEVTAFLLLEREPLHRRVYLAALQTVTGPAVPERLTHARADTAARVFLAQTPEQARQVQRQIIGALHALLQRVDAYNLGAPEPVSLQVICYTRSERALLLELLLDGLAHADLSDAAMTLLFHFQGPELIDASDSAHPEATPDHAAVPLLSAMSNLLALPIDVSYTLPEVTGALGVPGFIRDPQIHPELNHGLRSDEIFAIWTGAPPERTAALRVHALRQLAALRAVFDAVRARAAAALRTTAPRFQLPTRAPAADAFRSRVIFLTRYESFLRCHRVRDLRRTAPSAVPYVDAILRGTAQGDGWVTLDQTPARRLETGDFPSRLLASDDDAGRDALLEFNDYAHRASFWGPPTGPSLAIVAIGDVDTDALGRALRIRVRPTHASSLPLLEPGQRCVLFPRFTDFSTDRLAAFLARGDRPEPLVVQALRDPSRPAADSPLELHPDASGLGFTPSQQAALEAVCRQPITALWGPPGTGKTHFLASLIVALAAAHRAAGRPLSVVVSAFTNAAIEHLLRRIHARAIERSLPHLSLGKARGFQTAPAVGGDIDPRGIRGWLARNPLAVIGSTIHQLIKDPALGGVDLVVVDEASQLDVASGLVPAHLAGPTGRVVYAGDHLQLPPIIAGTYPDPPPGSPALHRSIFAALSAVRGGALRHQLLENFRMNDVLTSAAATLRYGPDYRPRDAAVASQRLDFTPPDGLDPLCRAILDPAAPLVVVITDGIRAARENPVEADLIARLTCALRAGLRDAGGAPFTSDRGFFTRGVFVVCPHHAQIQQIQQALAARRTWDRRPFVETVEKTQGQEAQAVIVGYGVSDPELAEQEAEFIYSPNRLNVAMTRARSKCVVCLPRPLVAGTPEILEDPIAAEGLAMMRRLVQETASHGERLRFPLDGASVEVLRAITPWSHPVTRGRDG